MSGRILVVEDDLLNARMYKAVLEAHGYTVRLETSGNRVMERVREFDPDIITMDILMSEISGLVLMEQLRADPETCDIPIVALTVLTGKAEETRIRDAGAASYLAKPVPISRLVAELGKQLAA